jgi:peptidoglycan/xylan/chitin deacetylase (PgdA/CDA1 family)
VDAREETSQDFSDRWKHLSGIPVEADFLHVFRDRGGPAVLGYPLSPGVYIGDTHVQYFTHGRLDAPGRSSTFAMGVPRQTNLGENLARAIEHSASRASAADPLGVFRAAFGTSEIRLRAGAQIGAPVYWRGFATQIFQRDAVRLMPVTPGTSRPVRGNLGEIYLGLSDDERATGDGYPSPIQRLPAAETAPVDAPVITYHATRGAGRFRQQLGQLLDEGLVPVSFDRLLAAIQGWATLPPRAFAVTFDDGWAIQVEEALPVLVELRVPATFFVMPEFERHGQGHMTVDQFRKLRLAGMTVGSHTLNHARLPRLIGSNLGAAQAEVVHSRAILEREVGGVDYFAYPNGLYSEEAVQLVRDSGYRAAVTTRLGIRHSWDGRFTLHRVAIDAWASFAEARQAIRHAADVDGADWPI